MRLASVIAPGCLFGFLALGACSDTGGISVGTSLPTLIGVDPADFLGNTTCVDAPGGARRYVTTLTDRTDTDDGGTPFQLGSSSPAPCVQRTTFGFVVPGNRYTAEIDIYDTTDIRPLGSGSRQMVNGDGTLAQPRWSSSCGQGSAPDDLSQAAIAVGFRITYVKPCTPTVDTGSSTTGLTVDVRDALGGRLECGEEPGQVARFETQLSGSTDTPRGANCGNPAAAFVDLEAGTSYTFDLAAFEAGSSAPTWSTTCFGEARPGVILAATCDPLRVPGAADPDAGSPDAGSDAAP